MDMMMLVLTGVSLVVAAVSAAVAWRATQAERVRSAARVAALTAAAKTPMPETIGNAYAPAASEPPAVIGLDEFLAQPQPSPRTYATTRPWREAAPTANEPQPVAVSSMFADAPAASGSEGRQHWLMGAAGVVATVVVAFAVIGFVSSRAVHSVAAPQTAPLELVALSHNRVDGALAVAGLVRNPPAGASVQNLEAEVRVFDAAGLLIGTRTAPVEIASLAPGQEAPFAVTLGELVTAARYRVSFRAAGTMRPHVDLRSNQPAAVTADAR